MYPIVYYASKCCRRGHRMESGWGGRGDPTPCRIICGRVSSTSPLMHVVEYVEQKQVCPITRECTRGEMNDATSNYHSKRFITVPNALFRVHSIYWAYACSRPSFAAVSNRSSPFTQVFAHSAPRRSLKYLHIQHLGDRSALVNNQLFHGTTDSMKQGLG